VINHYIIRKKSKNYVKHLAFPLVGFVIIAYVLMGMSNDAIILGASWFTIGLVYLIIITKVFKKKATVNLD
jgi:hypothetical protein